MDNIEKVKNVLKEFESSKIKDYDLFAYKIAYIFTGFIPARYLVINNDGKTM
jgi:hypothetical protein